MPRFSKFFKIFFPIILASVAIFLCFKNYTAGTYLIGWDSMHPEFDFSLNFERMLSHVWATEQGVGAISAHSDMADIPRIAFLWLASLFLPDSFIRYFYIFFCLVVGPLGVYFFLTYTFRREKESSWVYPAAFLGGLFYLLNLGTLQNFYVPLEMFTTAFAFLPWLIFCGIKYLREGKKKNLILFSIFVILISPMAYAATQAYAIYLGVFLFFLTFATISFGRRLKLKRFLLLGIVMFFLNIYWILPNLYSIFQQSLTISNANVNKLFSQEAFLRNADYGNLANILIQKSFLFSWRNFDFSENIFKDLLEVWNKHLGLTEVFIIGYCLAGIAILGLIMSLFKREKIAISFIFPLLLSLFFLFNINPPFGNIYQYLYDHFEIFREGFRTPFTKFSVIFELILSFYFGYFCFKLLTVKLRYTWFLKTLIFIGFGAVIVYFSLPAFQGNLVGDNIRVKFPEEYGKLFTWFREHPEGRIALMPIHSKYGWEYRDWGYEGSGFLTYGIRNPILYRDFDRWNSSNEDFYTQSAFALYANDVQNFVSTLKKYQVKYLLIDESVINAGGPDDVLKISEIKDIASKFEMKEVASFGFLTVYDTGIEVKDILAPETYSRIDSGLIDVPWDNLYTQNSPYIAPEEKTSPLEVLGGFQLGEGNRITTDLSINQGFFEAYNCDLKKIGSVSKKITNSGVVYEANGGAATCDYISFPELSYSQGYILHLVGKNEEGRGLKIYLFDSVNKIPYVEEILPRGNFDEIYFIHPRILEGEGYILNFETRSFGRISSKNTTKSVEFYPVDDASLQGQSLQAVHSIQNNLQVKGIEKYGTWGYRVSIENGDRDRDGEGLLMLGQGYEEGWVAFEIPNSKFQIKNWKLLEHIKVNSWANGWIVPNQPINQSTIYLIFWPQLLEWGGMVAGTICVLSILISKKRRL